MVKKKWFMFNLQVNEILEVIMLYETLIITIIVAINIIAFMIIIYMLGNISRSRYIGENSYNNKNLWILMLIISICLILALINEGLIDAINFMDNDSNNGLEDICGCTHDSNKEVCACEHFTSREVSPDSVTDINCCFCWEPNPDHACQHPNCSCVYHADCLINVHIVNDDSRFND